MAEASQSYSQLAYKADPCDRWGWQGHAGVWSLTDVCLARQELSHGGRQLPSAGV